MTSSKLIVSTVRLALVMGIACALFAQEPAPAGRGGGGGRGGAGGGRGAGGGAGAGAGAAAPAGARGGAAAGRVPLFFKEEWKTDATASEHPLSQNDVANANLELKVYGPSAKELLVAGSPTNETNPVHPWNGMCTGPCGLTLRHKTNSVDLTGLARIKWNTKVSGLHVVRPLIRLASGQLLVGDFADGIVADWQEREFTLSGVKWFAVDPELAVVKGAVVNNPDLSKVDEVGFIDLMPASGHGQGGWIDVAKFEVYGKPVPR
jgi:hypothetical protein